MATMKRHPTLSEHIEMAATLQRARAEILTVLQRCAESYPMTTGNAATNPCLAAKQILNKIDKLRCRLDSLSCQELDSELWDPALYYGNGDRAHQQYLNRITEPS